MKKSVILLALLSATNAIKSTNLLQISDELAEPVISYTKPGDKPVSKVKKMSPEEQIAKFYGKSCMVNSDCGTSRWQFCDEKSNRCVHKLLFPLENLEIWGTAVLTIFMAVAIMSGIGGGGVIVCLLMFFFKLDTKSAIAINYFAIFSGAATRFIVTFNERHPEKDATTIDYGISNIMLPLVMMGTIFGIYCNMLLPELVIEILLALVLGVLTVFAFNKWSTIYKKETDELETS